MRLSFTHFHNMYMHVYVMFMYTHTCVKSFLIVHDLPFFLSSIMSFDEQKFLTLMEFDLFLLFNTCCFLCSNKYLPKIKLKIFSPVFSSKRFLILSLVFKSILHFKLNSVLCERGVKVLFLCHIDNQF